MRRIGLAVIGMAFGIGCASAYQGTYDKTYQGLEANAEAERKAEEAAHADARQYVAIVYFDTGSAAIRTEGQREIDWFVEKMQPFPKAMFDLQGFADATGTESGNKDLSEQRTQAVVDALVAKGIAPERIRQAHYGDRYQAATNTTPQGRRDNRRVEISVI